jgi:hypothetical protein
MSDRDSPPRAAVRRWTVGDVAEEVLVDRFGGVFVANDQVTWVVKAVACTDADHAAIWAVAQRRGIEGALRVEDAGRSWREMTELTAEVNEHLRLAGVRFPFGMGPDIHREVVELEMGASDQERRMAAELEVAFRGRGLVITMSPGFSARFV